MERLNLPSAVKYILDKLKTNGFDGYVVGGCVRDSLMGIEPHDWDICTSALPGQMMQIFSDCKVIPTGLQHGTISVVIDSIPYEITTYRIEGEYEDNRHPNKVEFVSNLKLDLMRRDFTINALAYNDEVGLVDMCGGVDDIKNKIIRCVGNPDDRFQEDALRIMRAVRFAMKYNFEIERNTYNAIYNNEELLGNISIERISSELTKALSSSDITENDAELLVALLHCINVVDTNPTTFDVNRIVGTVKNLPLRLAIIFNHDNIKDSLKNLRFSNNIIDEAVEIREYGKIILDSLPELGLSDDENAMKHFARVVIKEMRKPNILTAIEFSKSQISTEGDYSILMEFRDAAEQCVKRKDVCKISELAVNGNDMISLGLEGEIIGFMLEILMGLVICDRVENEHDKLIEAARLFIEDESKN